MLGGVGLEVLGAIDPGEGGWYLSVFQNVGIVQGHMARSPYLGGKEGRHGGGWEDRTSANGRLLLLIVTHLEKTVILERLKAKGEMGGRGQDG